MYDTAWDMMKVIDWLSDRDDVDASRIGVTRISLGGMHTWFTAAADPRVAAAAPLIGVQNYRYALDQGLWHARVDSIRPLFAEVAKQMGKPATGDFKLSDGNRQLHMVASGGTPSIDAEVVEAVWKQVCPSLIDGGQEMDGPQSLRLIAPRPLLIANGEPDLGPIASGYFGAALLAGMWCAIGVFFDFAHDLRELAGQDFDLAHREVDLFDQRAQRELRGRGRAEGHAAVL